MTPEEKQLLLKDLCARMSYGVRIGIDGLSNPMDLYSIAEEDGIFYINGYYSINETKPYLRPMSSMTEEEEGEFRKIMPSNPSKGENWIQTFDWLNAHHFDYRGLIKKGLALEALEGMYETK